MPTLLSLCVTTRNRCESLSRLISEIHDNLNEEVELVIVDGASTDGTAQLLAGLAEKCSYIHWEIEANNSGLDRGYDRCVEIASGKYCWMLSDDDRLISDAIQRVVQLIRTHDHDLFIANSEVWDDSLTLRLIKSQLSLDGNLEFLPHQNEALLIKTGSVLSFIGCVIIKREVWLSRIREPFFGSWFIHIGVIFQRPLANGALVLAEPLIQIRYGVASWSGRAFDIWMVAWPKLIWSLPGISDTAKQLVVPREPGCSIAKHILFNSHSVNFQKASQIIPAKAVFRRGVIRVIYLIPKVLCNAIVALGCYISLRSRRLMLYDMANCSSSNILTRWLYRKSSKQLLRAAPERAVFPCK